jgi:hypothetical protein
MNQTSPTDQYRTTLGERGEAHLDRVLSDFFRSRMKHPWPAAPTTPSWVPDSEPSTLAAARTTAATAALESPRNQPAASSKRDSGGKSRMTLAVSALVLLGTCWGLSNSFQSTGGSGAPAASPSKVYGVFPESGASDPAVLKELRKDKAEHGPEGVSVPKIKLP